MKNLSFALRYLSRLRGGTAARVVSLTLGLAVGLLIFSYAHYNLSFDRCFRDGERIYQLWKRSAQQSDYNNSFMAPVAPAMAEEMPQIEAATRLHGPRFDEVLSGDRSFAVRYLLADTMFFDVLGFEVLQGDPHRALAEANGVMLARSAARRIFGDRDPVGRMLTLNGRDTLTVGGVFRDPEPNQHLGPFDMVRSFEYARRTMVTSWNGGDSFKSYVKLREGARVEEVEAQWAPFIDRHGIREMMETWNAEWVLFPIASSSRISSPVEPVSWILMALAALTLFVAAMNYALISISTLVSRSKTIAMLKVGGARPADIFRIFCSETAALTLVSTLAAAFLIWAMQHQIRALTGTSLSALFAPERIWVPLLVLAAAFFLASLIPARLFAAIPVTTAFRGAGDTRRGWKQTLLAVEIVSCTFTLTMLLLAVLQFDRLRHGDFGFAHDRLVYTRLQTPVGNISSLCDAVAALPEVESAGACETVPIWGYPGQPCFDERSRELLFSCRRESCNEEYLPTLGMRIVAGRNLRAAGNPHEVLVNETYVRLRGWSVEEAVGRQIVDQSDRHPTLYTVVGVVKDFRTIVVTGEVEPIVIHPLSLFSQWWGPSFAVRWHMMIRLRELTPASLAAVRRKIETMPSDNNHTLLVYDMQLGDTLSAVRNFRNTVFTVSGITLLIALTGLFGYLGDEMRRRSREIALRKVNGASTGDVLRLLGRDTARIALPSVVVGAAFSRWGADLVVGHFVERIALGWWIFALCALTVLCIVCLVQLARTWRIARENPIRSIKTE